MVFFVSPRWLITRLGDIQTDHVGVMASMVESTVSGLVYRRDHGFIPRWPQLKRAFDQKGILDEQLSIDGLKPSVVWSEYISMPSLGQGFGCRSGDAMKLWSLYLVGTGRLLPDHGGGMTEEGVTINPMDAIVGHIVVLDRQSNQMEKPTFNHVFGYDPIGGGSHMDLCVRAQNAGRFRVLMRSKQLVHINSESLIYGINRYSKFIMYQL